MNRLNQTLLVKTLDDTMAQDFHSCLAEKGALLLDGATGTNLFAQGLGPGEPPEPWNIHEPEKIKNLYQGWVDAGSDLFLTNTFGGNHYRLKLHNLENEVATINRVSAMLARDIADTAGRKVLVGGSMGPTGEMYEPLGSLSLENAEAAYRDQAQALKEGGVDVLWIETLFSFEELGAAVRAAKSTGLAVCATMSFDSAGRTMMGITPEALANEAKKLGLDGFGANCGRGASDTTSTIVDFGKAATDITIIAKGNCGVPEFLDGEIRYSGTPEIMADYVSLAYAAGARIIGGCCGTTTSHLAAMRQSLDQCLREPSPEVPSLASITEKLGPLSDGAAAYALGQTAQGAKQARPTRGGRRRRTD